MRRTLSRSVRVLSILLLLLLIGPAWMLASEEVRFGANWRTADHSPTGLAPDPRLHPEAIVQVYAARAFSWRAAFGIHTWIATKAINADDYRVYEVIGWRRFQDLPVLSGSNRPPDARWFDADPWLLADIRGREAAALIRDIDGAVERYPYADTYRMWPGPNSNTFTAFIGREVPGLRLDLPPTAIGKDYIPGGLVAKAPSGTGWQFSLFGLLGILAAPVEGVEVNLLSLSFGIDVLRPALRLPGIGRAGVRKTPPVTDASAG